MTVTLQTHREFHTQKLLKVRLRLLGRRIMPSRLRVTTARTAFDTRLSQLAARTHQPAFPSAAEKVDSQLAVQTLPEVMTARSVSNTQVKSQTKPSVFKRVALKAFLWLIVFASLIGVGVLAVPQLYYLFQPVEQVAVEPTTEGTPTGGSFEEDLTVTETPGRTYIPEQDENLPEGEWLIIPRIGVNTALRETEVAEEALEVGVWQVPDFGDPGDTEVPMILAAHRFGWQWWWQDDYWKYHSFYLLPDTEPGDRVEVIADQRKWVYEIYAGEEGDEITDYSADLILYTCKFLNSPVRHFRYAKLIDPTQDTQQTTTTKLSVLVE